MELNLRNFLNLLFLEGESTHIGGLYDHNVITASSAVNLPKLPQFFSINPLSTIDHSQTRNTYADINSARRADINVSSFRNFLFEIDDMPLDQQLAVYTNSKLPIASVTYSGGKSYHAIISLVNTLAVKPHTATGIQYYKAVWKSLARQLANGRDIKFDFSCSNPSRLSRLPTAIRDNGNEQTLISLGQLLTDDELKPLLPVYNFEEQQRKEKPTSSSEDVASFRAQLPPYLLEQLIYPTWVSSSGNYGTMYKLTAWAYDETGVSKDLLLLFLNDTVFKYMLTAGYEKTKMDKAVHDFYNSKNL